MGLNVGQSTRQTYSELMHWTSGAYEESLTFVGMLFVKNADVHHMTNQPPLYALSSVVVFLFLWASCENG